MSCSKEVGEERKERRRKIKVEGQKKSGATRETGVKEVKRRRRERKGW